MVWIFDCGIEDGQDRDAKDLTRRIYGFEMYLSGPQ